MTQWSRDDVKFSVGMVGSIIIGLATLSDATTSYGIPAACLPYLRLAAMVIGVISGKLATSPLPGDSNKIDVSRFRVWLLPLALAGSLSLSGCALLGLSQPPTVTTPAGQQAWTADQVVQQLGRFQQAVIDAVGTNTVSAADGRAIVTWLSGDATTTPPTVGLLDTIAAHPTDWKTDARVTWLAFRRRLTNVALLGTWLPIIDGFFIGAP